MSEATNGAEQTESPEHQGLQFFGAISASISHELKNVLAVINENAGLLEDALLMANQGMQPSPDLLQKVSQRISRQVLRGDRIIRNMNRFAHSVDVLQGAVHIHELLTLMVALMERLASRAGVELDLAEEASPDEVEGSAFKMQLLLFECLNVLVDAQGSGKHVRIRMTSEGSVGVVAVREDARVQNESGVTRARDMAKQLGIMLTIRKQPASFELTFG